MRVLLSYTLFVVNDFDFLFHQIFWNNSFTVWNLFDTKRNVYDYTSYKTYHVVVRFTICKPLLYNRKTIFILINWKSSLNTHFMRMSVLTFLLNSIHLKTAYTSKVWDPYLELVSFFDYSLFFIKENIYIQIFLRKRFTTCLTSCSTSLNY